MITMIGLIFVELWCAILIVEGVTYIWHRWVAHGGVARTVLNDVFRRRHFTHHIIHYPPKRLSSPEYMLACDTKFTALGLGLGVVLILTSLAVLNLISWVSCGTVVAGGFLYAYASFQAALLYHVDEETVRKMWFLRIEIVWRVYEWLRDYHLIHHFDNKNFAMVLPVFDILGGSYLSPSGLPKLQQDKSRTQNTFPGFDAKLASSCGEPLL